MRNVVLGGEGFIGRNLVQALSEHGHEVVSFGRTRSSYMPVNRNVTFVEGTLGDTEIIRKALRGADVVYYLISRSLPRQADRVIQSDISEDLLETINLLEICAEEGIRRVVYTSSGGTVYGPPKSDDPIPENHPTNPINSYGIVKLATEKYLDVFRADYGLSPVILRISNPFGPFQNTSRGQGVIATFMERIMCGEPLEIWGDGNTVRDYIYVKDVTDAMIRCATFEYEGRTPVFNVGSSRGTSLNELIYLMEQIVSSEIHVSHFQNNNADVNRSVLNTALLHEQTGWQPKTSLEDGLALTWKWMLNRVHQKDMHN